MTPRFHHFIDGQQVEAAGREWLPTFDPVTGQPWAELARGAEEDAARAVDAAGRAFPGWRATGPSERALLLWRVSELLEEHGDELALLEARDVGKVVREMRGQLQALVRWYRYYSSLAYQVEGRVIRHDRPSILNYTRREPFGVVGVIPAFNSPCLLTSMAVAPALAAGNTVVVKPAEVASTSVLRLAELFHEAGFPPGCVNVVTGYGHEAGEALVGHPAVRKVFFTGGVETGRHVAAQAGAGLKPTVLELGGKSANVVLDDARDLASVANGVIAGVFAAAGQTCVAGSRLVVHEAVADELVALVAARASKIVVGDPTEDQTEMGPLSQPGIRDGVERRVAKALADGATVVTGGERGGANPDGWFYQPTVLDGVTNGMEVAQEELFGPVLSVIRCSDDDEALAIANDSRFGLAAGVWTGDLGRAHRLADGLEAGTVWINTYRALNFASPFGGWKESGYGRENGTEGLDEFTQAKSVWVETSDEGIDDPFTMR